MIPGPPASLFLGLKSISKRNSSIFVLSTGVLKSGMLHGMFQVLSAQAKLMYPDLLLGVGLLRIMTGAGEWLVGQQVSGCCL